MLPVDLVPKYQIRESLPALAPGEQRFLLDPESSVGASGAESLYAGVYFAGPMENGKERKGEWAEIAGRMSHTHSEYLPQIQECQARGEGYMLIGKVSAGTPLRELLGARPALEPAELEALAYAVICGLEDAIDAGWPELPLSTRAILGRRVGEDTGDDSRFARLEIQLPIPPLCPALDDLGNCSAPLIPQTTRHYLAPLARLLYTLLGCRPPVAAPTGALPALPRPRGLSDPQFALLQAFLLPDDPDSADDPLLNPPIPRSAPEFFAQFFATPWKRQEVEQWESSTTTDPPEPEYDIGISPLYAGQFAWTENLRLVPIDAGHPPLQLAAGLDFDIGRSPVEADFVTQFAPRNPENERRTLHIARRHVCLRRSAEGECILENLGDSPLPELNGQPITDNAPVPEEAILELPGDYLLKILKLPSRYQQPRTCSDPDLSESQETRLEGACAFVALSEDALPFTGLWLHSDATLWFQDDALHFHPPDPQVAAEPALRLHHFAGGFWIERLIDPIPVTIDDWEIEPGHTAPLLRDSLLTIGDTLRYRIQTRE